jgi:quinol monooxygenase YgiN
VIIVAGSIYVDAEERDAYLEGCWEVIRAARAADGCLDFHVAADPIELGRINVFERWETIGAVEAFRGDGPSAEQEATIRDADVVQYEIASEMRL